MKTITTYMLLGFCLLITYSLCASNSILGGNDTCGTAVEVFCGDIVEVFTTNKTDTNNNDLKDAYYIYTETAAAPQLMRLSTCEDSVWTSSINVYLDCDLSDRTYDKGSCTALGSELTFISYPGITYYFAIDFHITNTGDSFMFNTSCEEVIPMIPANDEIENSIYMGESEIFYYEEDVQTLFATPEVGNPVGCNLDGINGVWYHFSTCNQGSGRSLEFNIYTPGGIQTNTLFETTNDTPSITDLTLVDDGNNTCGETNNLYSVSTEDDKYYYIFVANTGANTHVAFTYTVLGAEDALFKDFVLFPNPTSDLLNIKNTVPVDTITIRNILGAIVLDEKVNATEATVSIESLATGV